jgi:hypothetical protein
MNIPPSPAVIADARSSKELTGWVQRPSCHFGWGEYLGPWEISGRAIRMLIMRTQRRAAQRHGNHQAPCRLWLKATLLGYSGHAFGIGHRSCP